jgi:hypothetical protein
MSSFPNISGELSTLKMLVEQQQQAAINNDMHLINVMHPPLPPQPAMGEFTMNTNQIIEANGLFTGSGFIDGSLASLGLSNQNMMIPPQISAEDREAVEMLSSMSTIASYPVSPNPSGHIHLNSFQRVGVTSFDSLGQAVMGIADNNTNSKQMN